MSEEIETIVEDVRPFGDTGPTQKQVDQWKAKYRKIFLARYYGGDVYIYKMLTRPEYAEIIKEVRNDARVTDEEWFESFFVSKTLLWPENMTADELHTAEAGLATSLYQQISTVCKFNTISDPIEL